MKGLLLLVLLALVSPALAQDEAIPALDDHVFVPATHIEDPFLNGYVQTSVALGQATNSNVPSITLPDSTVIVGSSVEQLYFGLGFIYQHKMKDWLAVVAEIDAAGRLGSNTRTLIAEGLTGTVGYQLGWKIRAVETRSFLMSGSLRLSNSSSMFVNLLQWAEGITGGTDSELVVSQGSLRGILGLHAAWAINERFGLVGSGLLNYGESMAESGGNDWLGDLRMALSYNLMKDLRVPLGLALTAGHSGIQSTETTAVWFWRARIAAQSRADFSIGIDFGTSYFESPEGDTDARFSEFSINTRYFF